LPDFQNRKVNVFARLQKNYEEKEQPRDKIKGKIYVDKNQYN